MSCKGDLLELFLQWAVGVRYLLHHCYFLDLEPDLTIDNIIITQGFVHNQFINIILVECMKSFSTNFTCQSNNFLMLKLVLHWGQSAFQQAFKVCGPISPIAEEAWLMQSKIENFFQMSVNVTDSWSSWSEINWKLRRT